jgi:hypothetical protein
MTDTNEISINNFVEVTIAKSQPQLKERNINSIGIFTKDENLNPIDEYAVYKESSQALKDWGIDSITYKVINTIFSQSPNVNTGNGKVYVFKLKDDIDLEATSAYLEFRDLIVNNFKKLSSADVTLQFAEETPLTVDNLNFTNVKTIDDIAVILSNALTTIGINDVVVSTKDESIFFTRIQKGYTNKLVRLGGTLAGVNYLNFEGSILYNGSDAYTGTERLQDALARVNSLIFAEALLPVYDEADDNLKASADFVSDKPQLLIIAKNDPSYLEPTSLFDEIRQKLQTKARCLYYGLDYDELEDGQSKFLFAGAYLGNWLTADFNGSNTLRNLHAKSLTGILSDGTVTQTLIEKAGIVGADLYPEVAGVGAVFCSGSNEWFDTQYGLNALQILLENASFNALRTGNKIPQTSEGITIFENKYREVLQSFVRAGLIGEGKWTLNHGFGDAEDFDLAIEKDGFYIYTDSLADQLPENRSMRIKPTTYIAIKLQGAFNKDFIYIIKND